MKKKFTVSFIVAMVFVVSSVMAQTSPDDPAIIKAKEETKAVFDLGRMFGYLRTMEKEKKSLALNKDQMEKIYKIMVTIKRTDRVEPSVAEQMLTNIEDTILTSDQLMYTDQLAIEKMNTRSTGTGKGGGQITSYIAGGAFNPMKDPAKTIGRDFNSFFTYLTKKLNK